MPSWGVSAPRASTTPSALEIRGRRGSHKPLHEGNGTAHDGHDEERHTGHHEPLRGEKSDHNEKNPAPNGWR
jgi:hypothetical protein